MFRQDSFRRSVAAGATLAVAVLFSACNDPVSSSGEGPKTSDPPPAIQSVVTGAHTCALTITGAAYCWGYNANGQLGNNGTGTITATPVRTVGDIVFESLSVSKVDDVSCGLSTSGAAYCWGKNDKGQLGNNNTGTVTATPVRTVGGIVFASVSVSKVDDVTCGLSTSGAAYCWGKNDRGQLGDGTTTRRLVPTPVAGGLRFKSLAVGTGHACAVAVSGIAYCWGSSPNGAFGDGSTGTRLTPMISAPGLTFESIVAGGDYTCALTTVGAAYCWGVGALGQLGDGAVEMRTTPVAVEGGLAFRALAGAGQGVCGLTTDGKAYCWGHNFYGTVGDGTVMRRLTPVPVSGDLTFRSLSAGWQTVCGVTDFGASYCWGYNFGALGDGDIEHSSVPVPVVGGQSFRSVAAGTGYACAVTTTNAVVCWGSNNDGELGDGTTQTRLVPVAVHWQ